MKDALFKPGYDGARLSQTLSAPERQTFRQAKHELVRRIHDAMLTLTVLDGAGPAGVRTGSVPAHIVEFADRIGEEQAEPPRPRFKPSAAQVSAMPGALELLEGLTKPIFKVVMLRALDEFDREQGGRGLWSWKEIGGQFGLSDRWAEAAYEAALVQAARRSGLLPAVSREHGVLAVAVWLDRAWVTNLSTAADPRQAAANLRVKSPIKPEQAFAIWVPGPPAAKRLVDQVKPLMRGLLSHGSWYKIHPDSLAETLIEQARACQIDWMIEDIHVRSALAA